MFCTFQVILLNKQSNNIVMKHIISVWVNTNTDSVSKARISHSTKPGFMRNIQ